MFRIAHISDLHVPPLPRVRPRQFLSKRLFGFISWHCKWKFEHKQIVLDALLAHLQEVNPDHICVTGDITFTTLPEEVDTATDWLVRLGDPQRISLIPGNHDAYVPGAMDYALKRWSRWMQDDEGQTGFPYLHRRGPMNIIGLSSAGATLPACSYGHIGRAQLEKTETLLASIRSEQRPTLLMVHHPPQNGSAPPQKALSDRKRLQEILVHSPVDLILHGHLHYPTRASLDNPSGSIPILGAASASAVGRRKSVAHYHLIEIETDGGKPRLTVRHCRYEPAAECFSLTGSETL